MNRYRLVLGLAIAAMLAAQRLVMVHVPGPPRMALGCLLSIAFVLAVAEFATLAVGRRLAKRGSAGADVLPVGAVLAIATALLLVNLLPKQLGGLFALLRKAPPTAPAAALACGWATVLVRARRRGCSRVGLALALCGLVLGTRALVLASWPFDRLDGDMLATIDRALDAMFAGRTPYGAFPAPMPYLPGTLLAYAPAKLLGADLRWTNLALEALTVALVVLVGTGRRPSRPPGPIAGVRLAAVALPLVLLHPVWAHYGVNSQYAPSVLAAALLGLAATSAGPRAQAVALGLALGTNQMLLACAPILFAGWAGRLGAARASALSALAALVASAMIAPFLAWDAARFVEFALLSRGAFPPEVMAGRFSLLPIASALGPHAGLALSVAAILAASAFAMRARRPEAVAASMALGLGVAVMLQPVSFAHYLLPTLTLAFVAPVPPAIGGRPGPRAGEGPRPPRRDGGVGAGGGLRRRRRGSIA